MDMEKEVQAIENFILPEVKLNAEKKLIDNVWEHEKRIKRLLTIKEAADEYVNSRIYSDGEPVIVTRGGATWRLGFASHLSGDPGNFHKLGFKGYGEFYSIPRKKRNKCLKEIQNLWNSKFSEKELKKQEDVIRDYLWIPRRRLKLPECSSVADLWKKYQRKIRKLEKNLKIREIKEKEDELDLAIKKIARKYRK